MTMNRQPAGIPTGGQFAASARERSAVSVDNTPAAEPYGLGQPWNADADKRRDLELGLAAQLAGLDWAKSDLHALGGRIYTSVGMYRGFPVEEIAVDDDLDSLPALTEARERCAAALSAYDRDHPGAGDAERGSVGYEAVLPVIEAVQERGYTPGGFTAPPPPIADAEADAADSDAPPTKHEVADAKSYLDSLSMPRAMYRGDWERINGGHGPTVAQYRGELRARGEAHAEISLARAEYQRLLAAWEASDKTQDDDAVRCGNCGFWYDQFEGRRPQCGVY